MHTDEFEQAFSEFLDRHEYDEAENYLFSMVRLAFAAGWKAAGGEGPRSERVYPLLGPSRPREEEYLRRKKSPPPIPLRPEEKTGEEPKGNL